MRQQELRAIGWDNLLVALPLRSSMGTWFLRLRFIVVAMTLDMGSLLIFNNLSLRFK